MRCCIRIAVIVLSFLLSLPCIAADGNGGPAAAAAKAEAVTNVDEMMRTYLQLQAQIHETREVIERTRLEADQAAATNAAALSNRLHDLERAISQQRLNDRDAMQNSNRAMLLIAGVFVSVGLAAMLLTAYMHWRAVNRLADLAAVLPISHAAASLPLAAIGMGDTPLLTGGPADQTSARLLATLEQLEQRIRELEHHEPPARRLADNGGPEAVVIEATTDAADNSLIVDPSARIAMLIGKGQSLLNLDKAEEAVACFEEVLALAPGNTEALVKKGAALEKLRRPQEAIECYDRAISLNASLTIAYLHKGGLFNRLERFSEAMQCYEQALHTQEKQRAA